MSTAADAALPPIPPFCEGIQYFADPWPSFADQGATVIVITHDLQWVAGYAQRVIVLERGHLVADGTTRDVLADVDRLLGIGLEPLPVTLLARSLQWPPPLPLLPEDLVVSHV